MFYKKNRMALSGLVSALALFAGSANADVAISASHNITSIVPQTDSAQITFSITVANAGSENLNNIELFGLDQMLSEDSDTVLGQIDALAPGSQTTIQLLVDSVAQGDYFLDGIPLNMRADASTDLGQSLTLDVTSELEAQ